MTIRTAIGGLLRIIGILLIAWLIWRLFFLRSRTFEGLAVAIGLVGIVSSAFSGGSLSAVAGVPVGGYAILGAVSALVHRGPAVATTVADPASPWRFVVEALFFFGATALLAERRVLGALMAALIFATCFIGLGASYDSFVMTVHGVWRLYEYPTVEQWNGWAAVGLVLSLGFPLALAPVVVTRRWTTAVVAVVFVAAILTSAWFIDSRGTYLAVGLTFCCVALFERRVFKQSRLLTVSSIGLIVIVLVFATHRTMAVEFAQGVRLRAFSKFANPLHQDPNSGGFDTGFGRFDIWKRAAATIAAHPLLGVGPGRYQDPVSSHAHSMMLHEAAELGITGCIALYAIWGYLLFGLRQELERPGIRTLAVGFGGALVAYVFATLGTHYTSGLFVSSDRVRFLVWTLIAAAAATIRASRSQLPC